ncbi:MAG: DUF2339 domain-containing protein [Lentisphaerae bacterium]|nr:DUF2339 domain-containing protein [Lentisphaerota bacterium]
MEVLMSVAFFAVFIFLIIFPILCFCKLRSVDSKLSEIEYRINLLRIKNAEDSTTDTAAKATTSTPSPEKTPPPEEKTVTEKPDTPFCKPLPQAVPSPLASAEKSPAPAETAAVKEEKPLFTKTYSAPAKTYSAKWEEKSDKINARLSEFEERSAAVFSKIWSWICVGEEFRSKDVAKEYAIATTWLIRLGVIILLCGIGFFLKYSIDRNWTPPVVRVTLMLAAGLAMAVTGSWKSQGKYRPLAIALAGAGFATMYLSVMTAYKLYGLIPPLIAFGFMIAITVGAMASALGTNALLTAILGCTGGYLTPVFISTGSQNITALFIYMTILGAGTLLTAHYRNWVLLNGTSFIFYAVIGGTAVGKYLNADNALPVIGLLALNFTIFAIQNYTASTKRDMTFAEVLLFCGNIVFYLAAALPGAFKFFKEWQLPALLTIFVALLATVQIIYMIKKEQFKTAKVLMVFLQIELCFSLALTVPLLLGSQWVIAAWSILAFLLVDAACKVKSKTLLTFAVLTYIAAAWFETYDPQVFNDDVQNFLPQLLSVLFTAGVYIASLAASAVKLLKNTQNFAYADSPTEKVVSGLAQIFIAIACIIFFYCSSYEFYLAMHYKFSSFQYGILVTYWSVLVAITSYLINKYKLAKLTFIPLLLLIIAGGVMVINGRYCFDINFWKGLAYTLATAGVYTTAVMFAAQEFARISKAEHFPENIRRNAKLISLVLYTLSGIVFFIYSSRVWYEFLVCYLKTFRNGGLSVYWSALAFIVLAWGLRKQFKVLRMTAIALFCVVVLKIFFIDLANLEQIWRIVAFAVIGVVMLVGAAVYIRCKDMFIEKKDKDE